MSLIEQLNIQHAEMIGACPVRAKAWADFNESGLPGRSTETWRYTPLRLLNQIDVHASVKRAPVSQLVPSLSFDACKLVFVDGELDTDLSVIPVIKGLDINTSAIKNTRKYNTKKHPLMPMHQALCEQGVKVVVSENIHLDIPLVMIHVHTGKPVKHFKHDIQISSGAKADVLIHHLGEADARHFAHIVNEIELMQNSALTWSTLQTQGEHALHIDGTHVTQHAGSDFQSFILSSGAKLSRFDIDAAFKGEHASTSMAGVYQVAKKQHTDFHLNAEHEVPHCQTYQGIKGIADDKSKAVVNVRVAVHKQASKSFSEQAAHNLLLSSQAEVDAKPELEIYNDDVKCAHGATVGQLDENALFYLQTRGLSREQAESLLRFAFVNAQFDHVKHKDIKDYLVNAFTKQQSASEFVQEMIA